MTTNKPKVFEVYRTKQGTLENVVLHADYEALQAERDALKREVSNRNGACCVLEQGHKRISEERDALAAHVEALTRELTACQSVLHQLARDGEVTPQYADDAKAVLKRTKEVILARLKAQWQAEALGRVLAEVLTTVEADTVRAHLRNAMRKLRRQAEGAATPKPETQP